MRKWCETSENAIAPKSWKIYLNKTQASKFVPKLALPVQLLGNNAKKNCGNEVSKMSRFSRMTKIYKTWSGIVQKQLCRTELCGSPTCLTAGFLMIRFLRSWISAK
ncbi:MAG: hypothetical protein ACK5ZX_00910 [Bacteroidota bacterium]